jgi:hypothetical protein
MNQEQPDIPLTSAQINELVHQMDGREWVFDTRGVSPGKGVTHEQTAIFDGTLLVFDPWTAAFFASDKNADNSQPVEIQSITEDIDCEIIEPAKLPPSTEGPLSRP